MSDRYCDDELDPSGARRLGFGRGGERVVEASTAWGPTDSLLDVSKIEVEGGAPATFEFRGLFDAALDSEVARIMWERAEADEAIAGAALSLTSPRKPGCGPGDPDSADGS